MNFGWSEEHEQIREAVQRLCDGYDLDYWRARDAAGEFPFDFHKDMAAAGWLGIAMPEEYGGSGLGITEATVLMQTIAQSGAGMSGASAVHLNIFGPHPIVVHGTDEQRRRMLPELISGEKKACFAVTEPDSGLNTSGLKTRAERNGNGGYTVHGQKLWTSTAQEADKMLLIARTTPREDCKRAFDGLTLFYTDFDRNYLTPTEIPKMGRAAVDSNSLFIDGLPVPEEDRIGEEGRGFHYLLDGINPERILVAAEAVGIGRCALNRAADYARERTVFGRPIGQNQSVQHPLAESWAKLEAAELLVYKAAWLYDNGRPCGPQANAAKYLAAEVGHEACERAILTHGGMGYAKEYHVERWLREIWISRIAPVSWQLALSFIAEKELDLPKSY